MQKLLYYFCKTIIGWSIQPKYRFKSFGSDHPRYWRYCFFSNYLIKHLHAIIESITSVIFRLEIELVNFTLNKFKKVEVAAKYLQARKCNSHWVECSRFKICCYDLLTDIYTILMKYIFSNFGKRISVCILSYL